MFSLYKFGHVLPCSASESGTQCEVQQILVAKRLSAATIAGGRADQHMLVGTYQGSNLVIGIPSSRRSETSAYSMGHPNFRLA
mmetsp:Transcript_23422/g.38527  ORF Transcript_23422/g.38527 Transcript_23422/m.38527 type:complete len:83 (-) Transcript_23422:475-723(-)